MVSKERPTKCFTSILGNVQTASEQMREEEGRLEDKHDEYVAEALKAEMKAKVAEDEAEM